GVSPFRIRAFSPGRWIKNAESRRSGARPRAGQELRRSSQRNYRSGECGSGPRQPLHDPSAAAGRTRAFNNERAGRSPSGLYAGALEMLSATLKRHGFRVSAFESAAEMLKHAPANSVDLIISDIGMPELDGFEMIKQLRALASYKSVPAIALSGYAAPKDVRTAMAA